MYMYIAALDCYFGLPSDPSCIIHVHVTRLLRCLVHRTHPLSDTQYILCLVLQEYVRRCRIELHVPFEDQEKWVCII